MSIYLTDSQIANIREAANSLPADGDGKINVTMTIQISGEEIAKEVIKLWAKEGVNAQ